MGGSGQDREKEFMERTRQTGGNEGSGNGGPLKEKATGGGYRLRYRERDQTYDRG